MEIKDIFAHYHAVTKFSQPLKDLYELVKNKKDSWFELYIWAAKKPKCGYSIKTIQFRGNWFKSGEDLYEQLIHSIKIERLRHIGIIDIEDASKIAIEYSMSMCEEDIIPYLEFKLSELTVDGFEYRCIKKVRYIEKTDTFETYND